MRYLILAILLLLPALAEAQTVNSRTEAGNGTPITATGSRLDVQTQSGLALDATLTGRFPAAFASADNIAAQTATFMHGGLMAWDSGGGNWDRVLLTAGALNVQIQNSSLAVTGTFWQATQPISGTITANAGTNLNTSALALDASVDGLEGGIGASADAAATVGSTGSISAKLRLITSQLDALQTELNQKTEPGNTQTISGSVTGSGNFTVVQGTGTNLHMVCDSGCTPGGSTADNSAFTFGTTALNPSGYVFDDTSPNAVTENNIATPRMSANRVPYGTIRDAAGNERGVNVNSSNELLTASNTEFPAAAAISADNQAAPTTTTVYAHIMCFDGTDWDRCRGTVVDTEDNSIATGQSTSLVIGAMYGLNSDSGSGVLTRFHHQPVDYDSGAGTENLSVIGIALPASGGPVAGGTSTNPFRVDPTGTTTQPVSGTVTANAGTNLNTSALALNTAVDGLEAGIGDAADAAATAGSTGTLNAKARLMTSQLDSIKTSVELIDNAISGAGFNITQFGGSNVQAASNGLNTTGAGVLAQALVGQCDDTSPTALTENQFGHIRINCTTHNLPVEVVGGLTISVFPDNEPFNLAQIGGATIQAASNGLNTTGTGLGAEALVGQCDATTPQALTENSFGHLRINCTTHDLAVENTGTLSDDGAAAGTNRVGTLPAIAQASGFNSATAGRNTALNTAAGSGSLIVAALPEPSFESYSASATVSSASSATDIAILPGNANNTVLVTEVRISCTQTTAGNVEVHLTKRSTANTGGTSSGMTEVPDDANYSAADSAALTYTANPTTGSLVGDIDIVKLGCLASATAAPNDLYIGNFKQKPIVLRGTGQGLAVNLNSTTVTGGSFAITYKWLEVAGL